MRTAPGARRVRAGFTLVELMVVITIIAILIALTAAAISLALGTAHRTQLRNEISELNKAVIAVQTEYNVKYISSKIRLRENMNYGTADQLDIDSWNFLHAMWPRLTLNSQVNWNGDLDGNGNPIIDGPGGNAQNGWELEGEECLVFFTGGIPASGSPATTLGFSTNPANPAASGGSTRKGPYFPFQSNRLIPSPNPLATGFLRYDDPMTGMPYAYFSSFSYWTKVQVVAGGPQVAVANRYGHTGATLLQGVSDCNSLGVSPYADSPPNPTAPTQPSTIHYLNNDTFQIISAGANGAFGQGSMNNSPTTNCSWSPGSAGGTAAMTDASGTNPKAGNDDMANFYDNQLGIAP